MTSAKTKKPSPIAKAYLFSGLSFLIISWIASAIWGDGDAKGENTKIVIVIILFSLTCWSPSIGLMMFKKYLYGILGGLGRFLIIAGCAYSDHLMLADMPDGQGHPYLTVLGIMGAFTWGMVDFVLIYHFGNKYLKTIESSD